MFELSVRSCDDLCLGFIHHYFMLVFLYVCFMYGVFVTAK